MSQSILQTSFEIKGDASDLNLLIQTVAAFDAKAGGGAAAIIAPELRARLEQGDAAKAEEVLDRMADETGGCPIGVSFERNADDVMSVYGMENVEVAALGEIIRIACPSALPMSFPYSFSDDKPVTGAFGGGVVMITSEGVDIVNTTVLENDFRKETRDDTALSPLQRSALEAYDDDGMLRFKIGDRGHNAIKRMQHDGLLGDTLAVFVVTEVSDAGDDAEEAARMMERAAEQLQNVADALRSRTETTA